MEQLKTKAKKFTAMLMSIAVVLPLFQGLIGSDGAADAALSLSNVEELKSGGNVSILEIVPDASAGSLGYYIDGQEPCASWRQDVAKLTSPAARADYMNKDVEDTRNDGLLRRLENAKLMGNDTNVFPLSPLGDYAEAYPWVYDALDETEKAGYTRLELLDAESAKRTENAMLSGTFSYAEDGAFKLKSDNITLGGRGLGVVEQIDYFAYSVPEVEGDHVFWYKPSFTEVTDTSALAAGTPVYESIEVEQNKFIYIYRGDVKEAGFTFKPGVTYYTAAVNNAPKANKTNEYCYAAVSSGFRLAKTAGESEGVYFSVGADKLCLDYVAAGGNTAFSPAGRHSAAVPVSAVYYKGGYKNNDWFLRHVMDWEPEKGEPKPAVRITVNSVLGSEVAEEQLLTANLIVLSAGYALSGSPAEYKKNDTDISSITGNQIKQLCVPKGSDPNQVGKPIVVDSGIFKQSGSLEILKLARELATNSKIKIIKNVYCSPALVSSSPADFFAPVPESEYNSSGKPYRPVYESIILENEPRIEAERLPQVVSVATTLRHLLNGTTAIEPKDLVRVLSIEPGNERYLTAPLVKSWLGRSTDANLKVEISYVSTSQLVGMTEDICESYDLIYIGSEISGFATRKDGEDTIRDYFDDSMDGLVYTNIGDMVVAGGESGWSLSGLLDRDYDISAGTFSGRYYPIDTGDWQFSLPPFQTHDRARTFRYSGNDITSKKMNEIKSFVTAGFPVVIASDLSRSGYHPSGTETEGHAQFEISVFGAAIYRPKSFFSVSIDEAEANATSLTARWTNADNINTDSDGTITRARYIWYRVRNGVTEEIRRSGETNAKSDTLSLTDANAPQDGDSYYCELLPEYMWYIIFNSGDFYSQQNAVTKTLTYRSKTFDGRVDSSSYMSELLNSINGKDSVMDSSEIDSTKLNNKINALEHIQIDFKNIGTAERPQYCFPTPYSLDETTGDISSLSGSSLEYTFRITRPDNADPIYSAYTVKLYLDLNGDGRFSALDSEEIKGFSLRDSSSNSISSTALRGSGSGISAYYTLSWKMPSDLVGIIPWKLEVSASSNNAVRCSLQGFTHRRPEIKPTINVLQISSSRTADSWTDGSEATARLNLQASFDTDGATFNRLKAEVTDFNVNVITVSAADLDTLAAGYDDFIANPGLESGAFNQKLVDFVRSKHAEDANFVCADLSQLLGAFDMLIMGFDDCYQEISKSSAETIVKYISSGKATMFSHDNTSFFFLPTKDYRTDRGLFANLSDGDFFGSRYSVYAPMGTLEQFNAWINGRYSAFGYNFNMTIRDAVGLDRYGVTNKTYGLSQYSTARSGESGIVASLDYLSLTPSQMQELMNAGYSIAFKPGSDRSATVGETQGLTNGILTRYYQSGGYPTNNYYNSSEYQTTTQITQLNMGQITTYPFDMNTAEFGGAADMDAQSGMPTGRISITPTHTQYDQLNMNSDDITVWYCLAGGEFDYMPNDALNSYYIYNRGNVTYTGFGHTTTYTEENMKSFENEAKLLFNTIIAAYRSAVPEISFTDASGEKELEVFLIPSDNGDILSGGSDTQDPARRIFFKLGGNAVSGVVSPQFTFGYGETPLALTIYYMDGETEKTVAATESLKLETVYYIKLSELLLKLHAGGIGNDGLELCARVVLNGADSVRSTGDSITLRKLNLFDLG